MSLNRLLVRVSCALIALHVSATLVSAGVAPYTEDFTTDAANWFDTAGTGLLDWHGAGGPDAGAYVSETFNFVNSLPDDSPAFFRAQDEWNSSGGAFVGDWIASDVTQFSYFFRHNAPTPVNIFARFSGPFNFPGAIAIDFAPVLPNTWTEITIAIDESNPQFVSFEGSDFQTVFSNIGHVQLGISVPEGLAGLDQNFTFDLDKATVIPAPGVLALLVVAGVVRRRRR